MGKGPVTITCPVCREAYTVPAEVVRIDGHRVLVSMDRSDVYGHLEKCSAKAGEAAGKELVQRLTVTEAADKLAATATWSKAELTGRVHRFLDMRAFVASGGSRACSMCGMTGETCLAALSSANLPCCPSCREGNTHPAPGEAQGMCAEWSAARGAQD